MFLHESKFLKLLVSTILHLIGLFESPLWSIIYSTIYVACLMTSLFGSTIGFFNTHGKIGKIESFVCFYVNFEVNCMFIASILCRQKIKELLHTMENNPASDHDIVKETAKLVNTKIIWLINAHNSLAMTFVSPSLLLLIFKPTFSESDKSSEIIPYWFACDDLQKERTLNMFCWRIETKREYTIKIMLELMIGTMSYFGFCFCVMLYCVIIAQFCVHMKNFKSEIARLTNYADSFSYEYEHTLNEKMKNQMLVEHNERMNFEIVNIIKYLQYLKLCIREMKSTFKYFNNLLIAACFFATISVMFMGFNKSENKMLLKCTAVCLHGIISYILLCYFAQIISDSNEIILNEISTIPWYHQCVKFRKTYQMVLGYSCIPTQVKIFDARVINLSFLISTFKTAYSILNILLLKGKVFNDRSELIFLALIFQITLTEEE